MEGERMEDNDEGRGVKGRGVGKRGERLRVLTN